MLSGVVIHTLPGVCICLSCLVAACFALLLPVQAFWTACPKTFHFEKCCPLWFDCNCPVQVHFASLPSKSHSTSASLTTSMPFHGCRCLSLAQPVGSNSLPQSTNPFRLGVHHARILSELHCSASAAPCEKFFLSMHPVLAYAVSLQFRCRSSKSGDSCTERSTA